MKTKRIQIKDLKVGDKIKTSDNGEIVFETVTDKFVSEVVYEDQRFIKFKNGTSLNCSNRHPIMCLVDLKLLEVLPDDLKEEHLVVTEKGLTNIVGIDKGMKNDTSYLDITVNNTHTFFCSQDKNSEMVLTHNSQGGVRDGSATTNYPIWHPEVSDLLVLKNNKGTDDNRVKNLDYSVQLTGFFLKRMLKNEKISLFSTSDAPGLIDLWGLPEFDELYLKYEVDKKVKRTEIDGQELLLSIATERLNTGRLYISFIDNVNYTNQFKERITMSNLCQEISLPTSPIVDVNSDKGEIALCNLAGLNLGILRGRDTFHLMEKPLKDIVRALDIVIDVQEYPVKASEKQLKRRSIGVGVTNFAYWMAKNGLKYEDEEALPLIDELFEHFQYYLVKASMELAKERGTCDWFGKTKYAEGLMSFDNVNEEVKKLVKRPLTLDWTWLREQVQLHGMRNSVLSAQMPVESSSMVTNSTNGLEAPRELVTVKTNKSGASTVMVVPEGKKLASKYTLAWDIVDNSCINKITAVVQKWIDQAISVNHYYNPTLFEGNQIPAKVIIKDIVEFYKLGGKNLYYANTLDAIEVESEDCESCKL